MASDAETAWRKALRAKGRDWVIAELQRRPGRPGDAVYDIVFEEPYPTWDFCWLWCAEEDNRFIRLSRATTAALFFLILAIVCCAGAVKSWNESPQVAPAMASAEAPQSLPVGNSDDITSDVPNPTSSTTDNYSLAAGSLPSLCSYQTYETAECKTQK
jgi:hypothetical protein